MDTWGFALTLIGYLGLIVTAFSSVWGTLHDVTTRDAEGRKHLTRAGYVAISLVICGLLVNVTARVLTTRIEEERTARRMAEERLRWLRLASSSQPLQSLTMTWRFGGIAKDAIAVIAELQKEVSQTAELDDDHKLLSSADYAHWIQTLETAVIGYPWWGMLSSGRWSERPDTIIRIPLTQSEAVVLPLGALRLPTDVASEVSTHEREVLELRNVSAGIVAYEDADYDPVDPTPSEGRRTRAPAVSTSVDVGGDSMEMHASLEADGLRRALDKTHPDLAVLTLLPDEMNVIVLTPIRFAPWPYDNLSGPLRGYVLNPQPSEEKPFKSCTLAIVPNGIGDLATNYECVFYERGEIKEPAGPESDPERLCQYALLKLRKTNAP